MYKNHASTNSRGINISPFIAFLSEAQSFHTLTPHSVCALVFSGIPFILSCSNCDSLIGTPYLDDLAALLVGCLSSAALLHYISCEIVTECWSTSGLHKCNFRFTLVSKKCIESISASVKSGIMNSSDSKCIVSVSILFSVCMATN